MSIWQDYVLPFVVPGLSLVAVIISAKLSQRSAANVVEVDNKNYSLDVLKTSLATLTQDVNRAQGQIEDLRNELGTERTRNEEYRAKVDELDRERLRAQLALLEREKHVGTLEQHIHEEKPPPPPRRPW